MASCEQNPVNGDPPQISTPETSIAAPGNGGTVNFAYSITNAAADGKLTAEMAEWMHDFTLQSMTHLPHSRPIRMTLEVTGKAK